MPNRAQKIPVSLPKAPLTDVADDLLHQANGEMDRNRKFAIGGQKSMASITADGGVTIQLKAGKHYRLIKILIEKFIPHFVPTSKILYVGDTGEEWGYFNEAGLAALGVKIDMHCKMPDVVIHYPEKNWILLIEAVTSHGSSTLNSAKNRATFRRFHSRRGICDRLSHASRHGTLPDRHLMGD